MGTGGFFSSFFFFGLSKYTYMCFSMLMHYLHWISDRLFVQSSWSALYSLDALYHIVIQFAINDIYHIPISLQYNATVTMFSRSCIGGLCC